MIILDDLETPFDDNRPAAVTIGKFDGIHLGHQEIFQCVRQAAEKISGRSIVITFKQQPLEVLRPGSSIARLVTPEHKLRLIAENHIDLLYNLDFNMDFSRQTAEEFLNHLYQILGFKHLISGADAVFGRDRQGDPLTIQKLGKKIGFEVTQLPLKVIEGRPVTSSDIRNDLQKGDLASVEKLLGRRYSIYATVIEGQRKGRELGFPTANIDVSKLALPPAGVWAVSVIFQHQEMPGIANLGLAPTLRADSALVLEVHLIDKNIDLYGQHVEVVFHDFIRKEKKFASIDELRQQIQHDIDSARRNFQLLS